MRNLLPKTILMLIILSLGVVFWVVWLRQRQNISQRTQTEKIDPAIFQANRGWSLSVDHVSRSLLTSTIPRSDLTKISSDEIIWEWLKEAIAECQSDPEYREAVLPLQAGHRHSVSISEIPNEELDNWNRNLGGQNISMLDQGRRYAKVGVYLDDWICPNWGGVVDLKKAKLIRFGGGM
jgi:hypothetical protein